jgi:hypothetical protein
MKTQMKRFKAQMKRLMKPCKSLILNNETLGNAETLHRAYAHVRACTQAKPKHTRMTSHVRAMRFSVSMRFITMKTMILKRFIKRFIFKSSVSTTWAAA